MFIRSGRPPTLWCDLIVTDGPPENETDLDHVGVERALGQELDRAAAVGGDLLRLGLERLDEQPADGLALDLRLARRRRARRRKSRSAVDMDQRNVELAAEQPHHLLALAGPHQAVVDEDAGQLVADRLVDQHRGDRRIDAAGQAADHPALADLGADRRARLGAEGGHRPVALQAGDVVDEVADQPRAVGRVDDLGVEHQAVVAARLVGDQREGRVVRGADAARSPAAGG